MISRHSNFLTDNYVLFVALRIRPSMHVLVVMFLVVELIVIGSTHPVRSVFRCTLLVCGPCFVISHAPFARFQFQINPNPNPKIKSGEGNLIYFKFQMTSERKELATRT